LGLKLNLAGRSRWSQGGRGATGLRFEVCPDTFGKSGLSDLRWLASNRWGVYRVKSIRVIALVAMLSGSALVAIPSASASVSPRSSPGEAIVAAAESELGVQYCFGGGTLNPPGPSKGDCSSGVGFDCSGLVMYSVYEGTGGTVSLPHNVADQYTWASTHASAIVTNPSDLEPGDITVFGEDNASPAYQHDGIYVGDHAYTSEPGLWGSGSGPAVINAYDTGYGVVYSPLSWWNGPGWYFVEGFRVAQSSSPPPPPPSIDTANLLLNGAFDNDQTTGWNWLPQSSSDAGSFTAYPASDLPGGVPEGNNFLEFNTSQANGSVYQDVTANAVANQSYTFSLWLRGRAEPVSVCVALWGLSSSQNDGTCETVGTSWTYISVPYDPASSQASLRAQVYLETTGQNCDIAGASLASSSQFPPSSPTNVAVSTRVSAVHVNWSPPQVVGSSTVGYVVTARDLSHPGDPPTSAGFTATEGTVGDLHAGDSYEVTVSAVNGVGITSSTEYTVTVLFPLAVATRLVPEGSKGAHYSHRLVVTGGSGKDDWTVDGGRLPPGIGFSTTGLLSGVPKASGTFHFRVRVTDSAGDVASRTFVLVVRA
jgi:hypothetical protein